MDDATLRARLWDGFAALQTLLGGSSRHGRGLYKDGLVASIVPSAPDSPALHAAGAPAAPGMGAEIGALQTAPQLATPEPTGALRTVGRVNAQAYGNVDARLERTLTTLKEDDLRGYRADLNGAAASVALALHHGEDCGVSFVATVPQARRRGLATQVMRAVLADAQRHRLTTVTLQATEQGERLYAQLGLHRLGTMELWEHRR